MLINDFLQELQKYNGPLVFNPWADYDELHDISPLAPVIRAANLKRYLELRSNARYLFIAEGLGYQGGHFSGIAMTSERILLGKHASVNPQCVLGDWQYRRTSNPESTGLNKKQQDEGFNEPTATVMWNTLSRHNLSTMDVILWNIFPFHPYKKTGILTNRTPGKEELDVGIVYAKMLLKLIPNMKIISIGQKSANTLKAYGVDCAAVPHPSMGGATRFKEAVAQLFAES